LLAFVPIANFLLLFQAYFLKGDDSQNRFGPVPGD